jgi:hypothetical protein
MKVAEDAVIAEITREDYSAVVKRHDYLDRLLRAIEGQTGELERVSTTALVKKVPSYTHRHIYTYSIYI